jgi:acyl-CoA thioesterase FadM
VTAVELAFPDTGRVARSQISVRPSQIRRGGIAKLTDVAAALLDASFDDLVAINGGWIPGKALIVRSNVIDVWVAPRIDEHLDVEVACGGLARHWLEHRIRATGSRGAHLELSTSWALIDIASGRPSPLPDAIADGYADATGRRPRPVPRIPGPPDDVERRPWPVRADDLDGNDHVNNAAYFSVVAEVLEVRPVPLPHRIAILYRSELTWPSVPDLAWAPATGSSEGSAAEPPVEAWLVGGELVYTGLRITPLDAAARPEVPDGDDRPGQATT